MGSGYMKTVLFLVALLLAGCASAPQIDASGTVTCARFSTLTTQANTVYLSTDQPGTYVVQPDCTIAVEIK